MACTTRGIGMALGIMIGGLLAAVFGTILAVALGMNLSFAIVVYGIFGICGGVVACLASSSMLRNLGRRAASRDSTAG